MITEDYVSFELAKLLKENGFDEQLCHFYTEEGLPIMYKTEKGVVWANNSKSEHAIVQPTLQMAMKWLREVHNILIVVDYEWECDTTPYYFKIYRLDENGEPKQVPVKGVSYDKDDNPTEHIIGYRDWERSYKDFSSHEEACEVAIKYCLENLIVK